MKHRCGLKSLLFFFSPFLLYGQAWGTSGVLTITTDTSLAEDHSGNIVIAESGVTLNCNFHTVEGGGSGIGFTLDGGTFVRVLNCFVRNFATGISLSEARGNSIVNNRFQFNKGDGVHLASSLLNVFAFNVVSENDDEGFDIDSDSNLNSFISNIMTQS